jgi:hypothetical protein
LIKYVSGGIPTVGKFYFKCETKSGLSRILEIQAVDTDTAPLF